MNFKLLKVLRTISKIILILVGICIIGYVGLMVYKSVTYKPTRVRVSNVTDSSFTVSWVTDEPVRGIVYYKESKLPLTGPLGWLGAKVAYDDRDYSNAQSKCVEEFNASIEPDENFTVDGSNFNCENIKVVNKGKYYTHHVTVMNLDSEKEYSFVVGNGIWSFKGDVVSEKTFVTLEDVKEPKPIFGKIVTDKGNVSEDSVIYVKFKDGSKNKESQYISSTANTYGGWYVDSSTVRDEEGNVLDLELSQDTFEAVARYKNSNISDTYSWVYGYFNDSYPDIVVKEIEKEENWFDRYVFGNVYAACTCSCSCLSACTTDQLTNLQSVCGAGNIAGALAEKNGGTLGVDQLTQMGLCNSAVACAGNISAITGQGIKTSDITKDGKVNDNLSATYKDGQWSAPSVTKSKGQSSGSGAKTTKSSNDVTDEEKKALGPILGDVILCKYEENQDSCKKLKTLEINADLYLMYNNIDIHPGLDFAGFMDQIVDQAENLRLFGNDGEIIIKDGKKDGCSYTIKETWVLESSNCEIKDDSCDNSSESKKTICLLKKYDLEDNFLWTGLGIDSPNVYNPATGLFINPQDKAVPVTNSEPKSISPGDICKDKVGCICPYSKMGMGSVTIKNTYTCPSVIDAGSKPDNIPQAYPSFDEGFVCSDPDGCISTSGESLSFGQSSNSVLGTTDTNSYFFLPEYGFYTLSVNGIKISEKIEKDDNTIYIFYQEGNGKDGLQVPEDPENPQIGEDRIIKSSAFEIEYTKVAEQKEITLSKGINIISFNYVLKINDNTSTTATDYILFLRGKGYDVKGITYFENGRWSGGVYCTGTSKSSCSGNDFPLIPGKGYLVISNEEINASLPGYTLKDQVPMPLSPGWNLVGINGYTKAYTAISLIESINSIEGITADNISWWPTSKGRYEGVQVSGGQTYGSDFSISPLNGYFIRIKGYKPSNSDCKSIIWHEDGQLNGACGNSK